MEVKKISIVTPVFNRKDMLELAVKNVMAQNYPDVEHIIVDGGSTDGTQDMIKTRYPHTRLISEPDNGMYDALNKGLMASSGEIIGFLNTDDLYADHIFSDIAAKFDDTSVMAVAGCAIVFVETSGGGTEIVARYSPYDQTLLESSTIGNNYFNAWFFRSTVFEKIGNFNADYKIAGDRDFMLRFVLRHLPYAETDKVAYRYLQHPASLTFGYSDEKREQIAKEHLAMTDFYLKDKRLSGLERKLIIRLRTKETLAVAANALEKKERQKFLFYFYEGSKKDILWLFKFTGPLLFLTLKKAGKGFKRKLRMTFGWSWI